MQRYVLTALMLGALLLQGCASTEPMPRQEAQTKVQTPFEITGNDEEATFRVTDRQPFHASPG